MTTLGHNAVGFLPKFRVVIQIVYLKFLTFLSSKSMDAWVK